ncbi:MAG: YtxH domain-containing protein [Bacteroidota bacterium]
MKIATGLLAGAAVGTAILLALKSDKNDVLKQKVSDWLSDLLATSKDKLSATSNLLHNSLAKVKA